MAPVMPEFEEYNDYRFEAKHADAIIRTTSYHRKDFDLSVIWFPEREHQLIRSSISTSFQRPSSSTNLGTLGQLPQELLANMFLYLDIRTLTKCRQVNLRLRQAVDYLQEYQIICTHGLNALRALLRTRLARNVTLLAFYQALCSRRCEFCTGLALFMFLPTWRRCCFFCLQSGRMELQMQNISVIRKQFPINAEALGKLASFRTLPGKYTMEEFVRKDRVMTLVPVAQTVEAAEKQMHAQGRFWPIRFREDRSLTFMSSCALPYYDKQSGTTENGVSCAGCQLNLERGTNLGAMRGKWAYKARDIIYGTDNFFNFLEHFKGCKEAQMLWETSKEGSIEPPQLPQMTKNGGFFKSRE
ncbi:hypothetical protein V490_08013 [Pseudogymnoascus sp. VKM F-3557]|nr:hypothetical protein V490_08013 [Pseudogymnoascus sp. VKM F-3557]